MEEHVGLTPRAEEYLEAILNMKVEGRQVQQIRLAKRLRVSPPTVFGALGRLARDGLIRMGPGKEMSLTEKGERKARTIVRRHRLLEILLTDIIGLNWAECHEEACRLEHAVSERLEQRLAEMLGQPAVCPHGNPIPGEGEILLPDGVPLSSIESGARVRVVRIAEESTLNPELMRLFESRGLLPGKVLRVREAAPFAGTFTLEGEGGEVSLGLEAASAVWVSRLPAASPGADR